ncbi:single-stranded DNA-binding protein [Heliorestis convoluta]|uniref:Single-stranded DNA-binding protein n=1 Tax=Heliorestis convoluta TaxID=356322 RepID=A0A5Q2N011_9FIRM|nr:single-stranded DNA-binding protein [Heliorestis convoluta]QGG47053.1 single-stranded DNA-binding protein [Heliorestis convoluta]
MLNRVILIGRLGQDPELRHTNSGTPVCSFSIAVDRPQGQSQRQAGAEKVTDWINIVVWNQQAVVCSQYLHKGRLVAIDGRLQIRTWTDQQSGQKRSAAEVVAESVRFLERGENQAMGGYNRQAYPGGQPSYPANPPYPGPGAAGQGSSFQAAPPSPYGNSPYQPAAPMGAGNPSGQDFPNNFGSEISFPDNDYPDRDFQEKDDKEDDLPF